MNLKKLKQFDIKNKVILYRSPYDIATKKVNGEYKLSDNSRIVATLPTIEYLLEQNCKIVILTWVKRPENGYEEKLSTKPHAKELSKLINKPVKHVNDCIGENVLNEIEKLKPKELLMLENTRFHKEEFEDNDEFAKELAKNGEFIVFDAFPQSHRKHASTTGILRHLPSCVGIYMQKELEALDSIKETPKKPLTIIIGGAKISDKIGAIKNLQHKADYLIAIGGVANIFLKAKGIDVKNSFVEAVFVDEAKKDKLNTIDIAKNILETSKDKLIIPIDGIIADNIETPTRTKEIIFDEETIPDGWAILDIGEKTNKIISEILKKSETIFLNGPAGLFENPMFEKGTKDLIQTICNLPKEKNTLISGGDTIAALNKYGNKDKITHISLAGGATFEVLAGNELPVMKYLTN